LVTDKISRFFWDSCCFIAYLNDERDAYDVASLEQYIEEARAGKVRIFTSTIALAEVRPSFLKKRSIGSFAEFVEDLGGAVEFIEASPNVMILAGHLRDLPYKKPNEKPRRLATPDAIMLASCIYLTDALGETVDHFHTYDKGKKKGLDGDKSIPLLGFENWCSGITENDYARRVINISRVAPSHPAPRLT
jgi:predicted nucleic acid-binding protein